MIPLPAEYIDIAVPVKRVDILLKVILLAVVPGAVTPDETKMRESTQKILFQSHGSCSP